MDTDNKPSSSDEQSSKPQRPGLLSVLQSVLAAMFGVQSEAKRQEDFEKGYIGNYIFVGVIMVIIFVMTLVKIVDVILENS